jgi:hypothetical protein
MRRTDKMPYTNLSKLTEIDPINLDFSNLTDTTTAVNQLRETAQTEVGNMWFIAGILLIFVMLIWWFYRPDKTILLDMTRSIFIASSWCFFITTAFVLSGWITTIVPLVWFGTIFTISVVASMNLKRTGL